MHIRQSLSILGLRLTRADCAGRPGEQSYCEWTTGVCAGTGVLVTLAVVTAVDASDRTPSLRAMRVNVAFGGRSH
jgi:hypothetical protein